MIRPQYTTTKNRSIIGWQIKSDWFSTLDLGFTLLPALVKLYYLWASTNPLVAKVIYFQKRGLTPLLLAFEFPIIRYFVSIEFCRPLDIHTHTYLPIICQMLHFISQNSTLLLNQVWKSLSNCDPGRPVRASKPPLAAKQFDGHKLHVCFVP